MNEIKYVGTCPTCARGIEHGDDVVERKGVVYHDGCEPAEPTVESVPVIPSQSEGDEEMSKDELLEKLVDLVGTLTKKVANLESRPQAVSLVAAKPKTKAEKGAPRPDVYYVVKGYALEKEPPQYLKVSRAIAQAAPEDGKMTEMEVWNALMEGPHPSEKPSKSVGSWHYRQTPFYIFKYYRAKMIAAEYILGPFNL